MKFFYVYNSRFRDLFDIITRILTKRLSKGTNAS